MKTFWKIVLAIVIALVLAQVLHMVEAQLTMNYYMDEAYFGVWSKIMMPEAGPPPAGFYYYSIGFSLVGWIFFVLVYYILGSAIYGSKAVKGLWYGLFMFLVGGVPGFLMLLLLINLPIALVLWWMFFSLIINVLAGLFTALLVMPRHAFKIVEKTEVEIN
ncbi:MAG: hypothetical protein ACOZBH_05640 [Patescibacteria group bacterium]